MDFEIQSFFTKFRNLTSAGYKAHLNVSSENQEVFVSFHVNLGSLLPASFHNGPVLTRRRRPPAYHRRQDADL